MKGPSTWISLEKVQNILHLEPIIVVVILAIASYVFYRFFLKRLSRERHQNMTGLFLNLTGNMIIATLLYGGFLVCESVTTPDSFSYRVLPYIGLLALLAWANSFVRICQIMLFEYLFLKNMKVGVPVLLVNLLTLLLFFVLSGLVITEVFGVRLAPLFATSAIFSVVLGFALQDTLSNLFAGISLQIDKPFSIGDWIEIHASPTKWVGQVHEISWRSTVLIGWTEELITIPNKVLAQSQISNFSLKTKPIIRSQVFRLPFDVDTVRVKSILIHAALEVDGVRKDYEPVVTLMETADSWIVAKLTYFIDDYAQQYGIGDRVITNSLREMHAAGFYLAVSRHELSGELKAPGLTN